jgi:hypothetical protein
MEHCSVRVSAAALYADIACIRLMDIDIVQLGMHHCLPTLIISSGWFSTGFVAHEFTTLFYTRLSVRRPMRNKRTYILRGIHFRRAFL